MRKIDALLTRIARQMLHIDTLKPQGLDRLDFHEVSVWGLKDALLAAYELGLAAAKKGA